MKVVAFAAGAAVVLGTVGSAVRTVVLPRGIPVKLGSLVFVVVGRLFRLRLGRSPSYERRDGVMAAFAPTALLVLVVAWQVFTRQVIQDPSAWSEEAARYTFVWLGSFATALVFSERGHIAVDFLVAKLPMRAQQSVAVLVQLLILAFAIGVLVWGGYRAAMGAWNQQLTALPTQVGVMYLVMPITGLIIAFYAVHHIGAILAKQEAPIELDLTAEAV